MLGLGERSAPVLAGIDEDLVRSFLIGPGGLADDGGHVARAYGADALILVRPDSHIALTASPDRAASIADYLRSL